MEQPTTASAYNRPAAILFDMNETVLSLEKLKKKVNKLLGSKAGFKIWFGLLLQYSLVDNETGNYHNFTQLAGAALDMAAHMLEEKAPDSKSKEEVLQLMKTTPPHKEVPKALERLQKDGYRLAAFTNSPQETLQAQVDAAKLHQFEMHLSVDTIRQYKPALPTYRWAAEQLGLEPKHVLLVAAHGWDVTGAALAGMQTAFIARPGQTLYTLAPVPTFICKDLKDLAEQLSKNVL